MGENMFTKQTFFSKLNRGMAFIQANVEKLDALAANEFDKYSNEISQEEVEKVKLLDLDVKTTYSQVSLLRQVVKGDPITLDAVSLAVDNFEAELERFVETSGLKKYGFKDLEKPRSLTEKLEQLRTSGHQDEDDYEDDGGSPEMAERITEELSTSEQESVNRKKNKGRTFSRSTFKVNSAKNTPRISKWEAMRKEKSGKQEAAANTPQLLDYGLATRRISYWPKPQFTSDANLRNEEFFTQTLKMPVHYSDQNLTQKFAMFPNHGLFGQPGTPSNSEMSTEQVTVEITPGLTTKRPVPVARISKKQSPPPAARTRSRDISAAASEPSINTAVTRKPEPRQHLTFKSNKRITPEAPPNSFDVDTVLKTVKKNTTAPGTPQLPSPTINPYLHQRLLGMKVTNNP